MSARRVHDRHRTVSEKVGFCAGPTGEPRPAYRALVDLRCGRCGATIERGTVFARRSALLNLPQTVPHCQACLPLRELE